MCTFSVTDHISQLNVTSVTTITMRVTVVCDINHAVVILSNVKYK